MTSERQAKLQKFKQRIERERQHALTSALVEATKSLAEATDKLADLDLQPPVVNTTIDNTELVEAVRNLKMSVTPEIKINVPQQAAPVVNVNVPNDDISANYERYNSIIDPEGEYHGFVDKYGNWYIRLESSSPTAGDRSRFAVGKGSIQENWNKRRSLSYKPRDEVDIP